MMLLTYLLSGLPALPSTVVFSALEIVAIARHSRCPEYWASRL